MSMEAPKPQRDPEPYKDKADKERQRELPIEAPSLLSSEKEKTLWERFEKLNHIKFNKNVRNFFETGRGENLIIEGGEKQVSFEDFINLLETLNVMVSNLKQMDGELYLIIYVKHLNGNTCERVSVELGDLGGGTQFKVWCQEGVRERWC